MHSTEFIVRTILLILGGMLLWGLLTSIVLPLALVLSVLGLVGGGLFAIGWFIRELVLWRRLRAMSPSEKEAYARQEEQRQEDARRRQARKEQQRRDKERQRQERDDQLIIERLSLDDQVKVAQIERRSHFRVWVREADYDAVCRWGERKGLQVHRSNVGRFGDISVSISGIRRP